MAEPEGGARGSRRQWLLLAALLVVLAVIVVANRRTGDVAPAAGQPRASNAEGRPPAPGQARARPEELDVNLEALTAPHDEAVEIQRNPFRMEARRTEAPPAAGGPRPPPDVAPPPAPQGPPPIPLKFTGIIESETAGRIAALTDCRKVFHGREGDIIEGRYRIVRIGVESIVLEHVATGVRQTIRLSGCG
jgi:hypothetical protein